MQNELNHLFKNFVFTFLSVLSLKLDILLAKSNLLFYINLENYIKHHMLRKYAGIDQFIQIGIVPYSFARYAQTTLHSFKSN